MIKNLAWVSVMAALMVGAPFAFGQGNASDVPKRDISGTWTPEKEGSGIGGPGPYSAPSDGKHEPPYTQAARDKMKDYRPGNGIYQNPPPLINDPAVIYCDPQGMPRMDLYELRDTHIVHEKEKTLILYQYNHMWRYVWTDGRETMPKDAEPRWMGYSTGKWEDDYTFVVTTVGMDDRTWLDKSGRPHSEDIRVEERFHRTSKDMLEFTVTIFDPKMYTAPWKPLDKFPMKLLPANSDPVEMLCSVSEYMLYNEQMKFGNPTAGTGGQRPPRK
ncbi:MAG: hypothetical protein ABL967_18865 [Bryobacteraceae bacterium]